MKARTFDIKLANCDEPCSFGGGETAPSASCFTLTVKVTDQFGLLTVYLLDSDALLLIARPTLGDRGMVCDFRNKKNSGARSC